MLRVLLAAAAAFATATPAVANEVCVDPGGVPRVPPRVGLPSYSKGELRWEPLDGGPVVTYGWCDGIPLGGR